MTMLLRLAAVVLLALAVAAPASAATKVSVGTYNVNNNKLSSGDGPERAWTTARKALVVDAFEAMNADIVAFQEATPFGSVQPAAQLAAEVRPPKRAYRLATPGNVRIGILYDTRKMQLTQGPVYVPWRKAANSRATHAIASAARFRLPSGREFWFTALHLPVDNGLRPASTAASESWRQEALRAVVRTVRDRYAKGLPVVYAGDFNTYPGRTLAGGSQSQADAAGKLMAAARITETGRLNGGPGTCDDNCSGWGYDTWHNWAGVRRGIKRMDRIFVSSGWSAVTGWRIVREVSAAASDHFPVKSFLEL